MSKKFQKPYYQQSGLRWRCVEGVSRGQRHNEAMEFVRYGRVCQRREGMNGGGHIYHEVNTSILIPAAREGVMKSLTLNGQE